MVLNGSKEQLYSPTIDVVHLWHQTHPHYQGRKANQAKDLGSFQRAVGIASGTRRNRIQEAGKKSNKVKTLKSGTHSKKLIAKSEYSSRCPIWM